MAEQMDSKTARAGRNGFDPDEVKNYIERIENCNKDLEKEKSEYMRACKGIREDIKEIYSEAKVAGVPKTALKAVVKARHLERKAEQAREDLEGDEQDAFDNIRHALGDLAETPLGQAAMAAAQ